MKRALKIILGLSILICVVNIPPFSTVMMVIFGPLIRLPFRFTTKDFQFCHIGPKEKIYSSTDYEIYKTRHPNADHTVYRFYPQRDNLRFWMWGEYMFDEDWKTPYIEAPYQSKSGFCPPGTSEFSSKKPK